MPVTANNAALLEKRLTLVSWFAGALGYADNAEMFRKLKNVSEGWGDRYNKALENRLTEQHDIDARTLQQLQECDAEIHADWLAITRARGGDLSLKYFQYLAALASGLFLSRLKDSPHALLQELRRHADCNRYTLEQIPDDIASLHKLAFWMATGSGKTLLMHLHYRQFMRHQRDLFIPDNVLLITPNEELSRQHLAEMRLSGIPCHRHGDSAALLHKASSAVRVIEITKLASEHGKRGKSKGKGERAHVEAFAGRNLIFVDEGHKGAGGEEWFRLRDMLANSGNKNGFVFEYSATFGQALNVSLLQKKKPAALAGAREYERAQAYARSILFDYSYRYFHHDGYGKDFAVLGIQNHRADIESERLLMLGNLLKFFQQQREYENNQTALREYNIEKPLLLWLGSTVTGSSGGKASDVQKILAFLHQVAADEDETGKAWLQQTAAKLLAGRSGLSDAAGKDVFAGQFEPLKKAFGGSADGLPAQMRKTLFNSDSAGALRLSRLKQAPGEAALSVGISAPFALVYVGDIKKLSEMVSREGLIIDDDSIQPSLFAHAHLPQSPINILIGAKKFMEGWSSWRVSSMGLLDIGKSEGTQIIQLFGRGVRLQGRGFSLKRATPTERQSAGGGLAECLSLLETLNIFAIRADFMNTFRDYLQREGVLEDVFSIPIKIDAGLISGQKLRALQFPPADEFDESVELLPAEDIKVILNYGARVQSVRSGEARGGFNLAAGDSAAEAMPFTAEIAQLLDFNRLYRRLLEYKHRQARQSLLIRHEQLEAILQSCCSVIGGENIFNIKSFAGMRRLQEIAFTALCRYADKLYFRRLKQWETENIEAMPLFDDADEPAPQMRGNFSDYEIRIPQGDEQRLEKILNLLKNERRLYQFDGERVLPRVKFDRHLYMPLLLEDKENPDISIRPPGLTESEAGFIRKLNAYLKQPDNQALKESVFLLRNAGKGKGIGFYEDEGFYPDFILWIKQGGKERLVLIEPHGMMHAPAYSKDYKARLWEQLQALTARLQKNRQWKTLSVDSYIVSETSFDALRKRYGDGDWSREKFRAHHILFAEDDDLMDAIIR